MIRAPVTPTPKPGIQSARRHSSSCRWCAAGACARSSTCMSRNRGPGRRTMSNSPGPRPSGPWRRSSAPVRRQPCWRARHSSRRSPIRSSRWSGRRCPTASTTTTISVVRLHRRARGLHRRPGLEWHVPPRRPGAGAGTLAPQSGDRRALPDRISSSASLRRIPLGHRPRAVGARRGRQHHPLVRHLHGHPRAEVRRTGAAREPRPARGRKPGARDPQRHRHAGRGRPGAAVARAESGGCRCRAHRRPVRRVFLQRARRGGCALHALQLGWRRTPPVRRLRHAARDVSVRAEPNVPGAS